MTFDAFRAWLTNDYVSPQTGAPLDPRSASSYVSDIRGAASLIGEDLEGASADRLEKARDRLRGDDTLRVGRVTQVANMITALARYRDFVRDAAPSPPPPRRLHTGVPADVRVQGLIDAGFRHTGTTQRLDILEKGAATIYVKRQSNSLAFVIHPALEAHYSRLTAIDKVRGPTEFGYYHDDGMRRFPKRRHGGEAPIPYGLDFNVGSIDAFARLVVELTEQEQAVTDDAAAENASDGPAQTERRQVVLARAGQGRFRADLMSIWKRCPITHIERPELLRASHIKPWCASNDTERLDPDNGLLLAVHLDVLFDKGFITFEDDGKMRVSEALSDKERRAIGLTSEPVTLELTVGNRRFLEHHRAEVFLTKPGRH